MYTLISRLCFFLQRWPKTLLVLALIVSGFSLYSIRQIKIQTSLLNVLPENIPSVKLLKEVQEKLGTLGELTIILKSDSSAENRKSVEWLVHRLKSHPQISFLDYQREPQFFYKHKLLYIDINDLRDIENRLETQLWGHSQKYNPILVDLLSGEEKKQTALQVASFADLEKKYLPKLQNYLGTQDQKILVIRIFPNFEITNYTKCADLLLDVKSLLKALPSQSNWYLTGQVIRRVQDEGRLVSEIKESAWVSVLFICACLFFFYHRMPTGILSILICIGLGILWTLGLSYWLIGHLNILTLSLGIILLGLGLDSGIHLLSRYREARETGLSSAVAFETVLLEAGPAITTCGLSSAAAFFAVSLTDFKLFSEFGLLTGIGMVMTLIATLLIFPALLRVLESIGLLPILGLKAKPPRPLRRRPYTWWKYHLLAFIVLSVVFTYEGFQSEFEYNLDNLDFPNQNYTADSLYQITGEAIRSPSIAISPNQESATKLANHLRKTVHSDSFPRTIHSVLTLTDLLPSNQAEKLQIIKSIRKKCTPALLNKTPEQYLPTMKILYEASQINDTLTTQNIPDSFRRKFLGLKKDSSVFTFIFPSIDPNDGQAARAFARITRNISLDSNEVVHSTGMAIIYADLLNKMIPDSQKATLVALAIVFILVLLDMRSFKATLIMFTPIGISIIWALGLFQHFGIKLSFYNLIFLPVLIGVSMDISVHLLHRYLEEGQGSFFFVLKRTRRDIGISIFTSIAGFFGLALSSHQGLQIMGWSAIIGLVTIVLATYTWVPFIIGYLDERNLHASPPQSK